MIIRIRLDKAHSPVMWKNVEEFSRRGSSVAVAVPIPTLSTELAKLTDTLWHLFEEQYSPGCESWTQECRQLAGRYPVSALWV